MDTIPAQDRQKARVKVDLWDLIDIEKLNELLDQHLESQHHIASDISYRCIDVTPGGILEIVASYLPVEY